MKNTVVKIIPTILVLFLAFTLLVGCGDSVKVGDDSAVVNDQYFDEDYGNYSITVNLVIGNSDPTKDALFSGKVTMNSITHMAYDAVEAACASKGIEIIGLNGYSSFITTIAGVGYVENDDGTYSSWTTSINGNFSPGIGAQQLRDGDLFEVSYVTKEKTW